MQGESRLAEGLAASEELDSEIDAFLAAVLHPRHYFEEDGFHDEL